MVLDIPCRRLSDVKEQVIFSLNIDHHPEQFSRRLTSFRRQVKTVNHGDEGNILLNLVKFLLNNIENFQQIKLENGVPESGGLKYPVKMNFLMSENDKLDLEKHLININLRLTSLNTHFDIIFQALIFAQTYFTNFSSFLSENSPDQRQRPPPPALNNLQNGDHVKEDHESEGQSCCYVCGAEIEPGPFSFSSQRVSSRVCGKCIRFSEMSSNTDMSGMGGQVVQVSCIRKILSCIVIAMQRIFTILRHCLQKLRI